MSAQWADIPSNDVGLYNTDAGKMLDGTWAQAEIGLVNDPDPSIGSAGRVVYMEGNSGSNFTDLRYVLSSSQNIVGMSQRVWVSSIPSSFGRSPEFASFRDAGNNTLACAIITPTGSIQIRKGLRNNNVTVAETSGPVVTANAWHHISIKMNWSTSAVSIEREGVPVLSVTGIDIGTGPCYQVASRCQSDGAGFSTPLRLKDIFYWDGAGSLNNDHPGPVTVYRRKVVSDVSSGWTKSTGTSDYQLLDESPPDDADYISAPSTLPSPSIMGLEDLPTDVVAVRAVCLVSRQRKTDGGDCKTQMSITPDNGSNYALGSDRAITTAFTYWHDWAETSPATGLSWTPVEFNNSRLRINRTL